MFTGLVREVGRIETIGRREAISVLELSAPLVAPGLAAGDSLAVNGICLTVTDRSRDRVRVEATVETRRVTTLSGWRPGERVHLEPSLRVGDQVGGHFVLGHVDGVGRLAALERKGGAASMRIELAPELAAELVPKGSIAVDGVSLTLDAGPFHGSFTVTLVPHTLGTTRFESLSPGALVNLELDMLAKAAARAARAVAGAATTGALPANTRPTDGATPRGGARAGDGGTEGRTGTRTPTIESIRARGWQHDRER